jgi:hypothetical protein
MRVFLSCVSVLQVIYIQAFILVILMGKLMRKVFFGQLRAAEFEVLYFSQSLYRIFMILGFHTKRLKIKQKY